MPDLLLNYRTNPPYFETFVMDDEHPDGKTGFLCRACRRDVTDGPCPDHAPREVPGLALVECEATPRHWAWVLASDANGYGIPCWSCIHSEKMKELEDAAHTRHLRWSYRMLNGWRRWSVTRWTARKAYALGLISGYQMGFGGCCDEGVRHLGWSPRRARPYILGFSRETWRCWLVGHHRRGEEAGLGYCGKCVPWTCCGAKTFDHADGCVEA